MQEVMFDSNSYRYLVRGKTYAEYSKDIVNIKTKEKIKNLEPRQNIVVLTELLKHLVDNTDPDYEECKNAIAASVLHCRKIEGGKQSLPYVPGMVYSIYFAITGKQPDNFYERTITTVADRIANNLTDEYISSIQEQLKINCNNESLTRQNFYDGLVSALKIIDPSCSGFSDFLRNRNKREKYMRDIKHSDFDKMIIIRDLSLVMKTYNTSFEVNDEMIKSFTSKFRPAILLERKLWEKMLKIGIKDSSHPEFNTFYDIMILTGGLAVYPQIIFVTREDKIIDSFFESGLHNQIFDLFEYFKFIDAKGIQLIKYPYRKKQ